VKKSKNRKYYDSYLDFGFTSTSIPSNALLASYKVAHRMAKCKKPLTIAEELILPAAVDMVNIKIG
jgi:hypothetical protein